MQSTSIGGLFKTKIIETYNILYSDNVLKMVVCIYDIEEKKVNLIMKKDTFINPTKIFSGDYYGIVDIMNENDMEEIIGKKDVKIQEQMRKIKMNKCEFFEVERANNASSNEAIFIKIGKAIIEPKNIYWNLTHAICIAIYEDFCVLIKNKNEKFSYFKSIYSISIINGYFLENLFFYITEESIGIIICDF